MSEYLKEQQFKDRLYQALSLRGKKPVDLVKNLSLPKATVSFYLNGRTEPKADRLYILAKYLDVNELWLMGYNVPIDRVKKDNSTGTSDDLVLEAYNRLTPANQTLVRSLIEQLSDK